MPTTEEIIDSSSRCSLFESASQSSVLLSRKKTDNKRNIKEKHQCGGPTPFALRSAPESCCSRDRPGSVSWSCWRGLVCSGRHETQCGEHVGCEPRPDASTRHEPPVKTPRHFSACAQPLWCGVATSSRGTSVTSESCD